MMSPAVAFKDNAAEMTEPTYMVALSPTAAREAGADVSLSGDKSLTGAFMNADEVKAASQPGLAANVPPPAISPAQVVMNAESAGAALREPMQGVQYQPPISDLGAAAGALYNNTAELGARILDFFADKSPDPEIEPPAHNPAPPQQHFTLG